MITFDRDVEAAKEDIAQLKKKRQRLIDRAKIFAALRSWFNDNDFLEMESPVRLPCPALEDYIDAVPSGKDHWLRTSPELHLKRLLAAEYDRIFEIGPCFRAGEFGDHHRTEFTMLEWYRRGGTWTDLMEDAQGMIRTAINAIAPGKTTLPFRNEMIDYSGAWPQMTVDDAFRQFAGLSVHQAISNGTFEEILCTQVEPHLGDRQPTFLTEYPVECSGLAARLPGKPGYVARWELYIRGLEIGNACTELVDPPEQERRFLATERLRSSENRPVYPMDQHFMNAIWNGITPSAGTAIGLDRLVMALTNAQDIAQVRTF